VTRLVIEEYAASGQRTVVFGSSAGGMLTSCLIPYLDDVVSGYVCHGIHNPVYARRHLGYLLGAGADVVPWARLPYRLLPRHIRVGISEHDVVRQWFRPGSDPLATFNQTLRSVFSMTVAYRPLRPPSAIRIPVLVIAGTDDSMIPLDQTRASARRLRLPELELKVLEGGHMLLHEHPHAVLDAITSWMG